jgi:hypothetical protein
MSTFRIENSIFNAYLDQESPNYIYVEIKGLGVVSINRTDEGVIIDVHDNKDCHDSIASLGLDHNDFSDNFSDDLQREIERYDPSISLDAEECLAAYLRDDYEKDFITNYFQENPFNLENLITLKLKSLPVVTYQDLAGVSIRLTNSQKEKLNAVDGDFFITKGGKVCMCFPGLLLPLRDNKANEILSEYTENLSLADILNDGELKPQYLEKIKDAGGEVGQSNADYTDFEFDVTYQSEELGQDRCSLNLHVIFDWQKKHVYMILGTNLGRGFNEHHEVAQGGQPSELALEDYIAGLSNAAKIGTEEDEYLFLITKHPDSQEAIKAATAKLLGVLGLSQL